jgi:hypothetical protein
MKKQVLIAGILLGLAFRVSGFEAVYDAANHTVNIANLLKDAETTVKTTETALNTLKTYENTVLQVARFGDPAALQSIPGISTVADLYGAGQRLMSDYQQWQGFLNPRRYQNDFNYILGSYQQPQWNGFQSLNGSMISPNQGLYQWDTARYNIASAAQEELKQLEEQRQRLEQRRDAVLQSLQGASSDRTAADVAQYHAVLDGLNGALAEVGARENQVAHQVRLKNQQIGAGQEIYRASQAERIQASDYQTIDAGLNGLPIGDMNRPVLWGPAR